MKTFVIVYDRSGGERNRWEDGPVPREGEYVREQYGREAGPHESSLRHAGGQLTMTFRTLDEILARGQPDVAVPTILEEKGPATGPLRLMAVGDQVALRLMGELWPFRVDRLPPDVPAGYVEVSPVPKNKGNKLFVAASQATLVPQDACLLHPRCQLHSDCQGTEGQPASIGCACHELAVSSPRWRHSGMEGALTTEGLCENERKSRPA